MLPCQRVLRLEADDNRVIWQTAPLEMYFCYQLDE